MIANALSHDSPPATPVRRPDNRLSVTVSNTQANKSGKAGRYVFESYFYPTGHRLSCLAERLFPVFFPFNFLCSLFLYFFVLPLAIPHVPTTLSVVSQPADEGTGFPAVKRRRVTAEMEGKYIINMPKGTTPRTRRILAQQAKKGRPDPVALPGNSLE